MPPQEMLFILPRLRAFFALACSMFGQDAEHSFDLALNVAADRSERGRRMKVKTVRLAFQLGYV